MIFGDKLLPKVLDGSKTVTRRPAKPGNSLHGEDWRPCKYKVDKTYAVQPGRGKKAVARIRILDVKRVRLGVAASWPRAEALREGFTIWRDFAAYWDSLYGSYDPTQLVDRIEFELVGTTEMPERAA